MFLPAATKLWPRLWSPARRTPPGRETPLARRPLRQGDLPSKEAPRHTVNKRPVRILLECILVLDEQLHKIFQFCQIDRCHIYKELSQIKFYK